MVVHEGLGPIVGRCLGLLYTYNGVVVLQDPERLQGKLKVLIGLFCRYGLVANSTNFKAMPCQAGTLRSGMSEEAVVQWCTIWR